MADYVSVDQFNHGWSFFAKKIKTRLELRWGKFPCLKFSCSGCDDWLDADNQNRNIDSLSAPKIGIIC